MKKYCFLYILTFLILTGCASLPEMQSARRVERGETPALNQGEIIIYGRILFIENGKSKAPYGLGKPIWQLMSLEPKQAADTKNAKVKMILSLSTREDGVFSYIIPAGHYQMTHVEPFYYTPMISPAIEFDASEPSHAYYLGDLEIDIDTTSWLGGLWGNYITHLNYLEVMDRFDAMQSQLTESASASVPMRKALLTRMHGRIPKIPADDTPATSGSVKFGN